MSPTVISKNILGTQANFMQVINVFMNIEHKQVNFSPLALISFAMWFGGGGVW